MKDQLKKRSCFFLIYLLASLFFGFELFANDDFSLEDIEFFERKIRPLLSKECYNCHSRSAEKLRGGLFLDARKSVLKGGDSGEVVVLGEPSKSRLIEAIGYENVDLQMPPKTKLHDDQIADLRIWIEKGLPWPKEKVAETKADGEFDLLKRRSSHWAWQAFKQVIPPKVQKVENEDWARNPIDAFIIKRLEAQGLFPAKRASRRDLIRRLSYALIGLPPSPKAVRDFERDRDPFAYNRLIDALLASPQFGERWARHWLDLVRYSETMGHEFDYEIPNAWRYRDYLIRAFSEDVPYDQFVREHIAGDLLSSPRLDFEGKNESIIGTGFYWFGQQVHSPVDIEMNQLDVIDNQIDVLSKTFLGMTVSCARCHDHKFDAISTRDFYSLYGSLSSSRYNEGIVDSPSFWDREIEKLKEMKDVMLAFFSKEWRDSKINSKVNLKIDSKVDSEIDSENNYMIMASAEDGFEDWFFDGPSMKNALTPIGEMIILEDSISIITEPILHSARFSTRLQGSLRSPTFEISERYLHVLVAGRDCRANVVIDNFNLIRAPIYGGLKKQVNDQNLHWVSFDLGRWKGHDAYFEIKDSIVGDLAGRASYDSDAWFAVSKVIFSPHSVVQKIDSKPFLNFALDEESIEKGVFEKGKFEALRRAKADYLVASRGIKQPFFVPSMTEGSGRDQVIFVRGNPRMPGEMASRGFLEAFGKTEIGKGSGRLSLANRVANSENPLTARVYVNRLWHHLFGRGIVESTDNFGVLGSIPTHPELLDWLANWFVNDGNWSTKKLLRLMAGSATFQMSSSPDQIAQKADPANRLFHHIPVRRLEGEALRDAILQVSGDLRFEQFGSPTAVYLTTFMTGRGRPRKSGPLDGEHRRTIYQEVRRNFLSPMMLNFDAPIPHTSFGKRSVSNVPAQALILMNDPFVIHQSRRWAGNLLRQESKIRSKAESRIGSNFRSEIRSKAESEAETKVEYETLIETIYITALGRYPSRSEREKAMTFLAEQEENHLNVKDENERAQLLWADFCHVIFNLKEFIFIR